MSSGRCWSSDTYNPVPGVMEGVPSGNNYQGGFGTQLMAKVRLVTSTKSLKFCIALLTLTETQCVCFFIRFWIVAENEHHWNGF